mmetsp:Transcript_43361/g.70355  ORF Transcript_43361/g.70355 Transcript_43361/m.70355 type:complete len:484 (-) Transcript_43361:245-1696(-)
MMMAPYAFVGIGAIATVGESRSNVREFVCLYRNVSPLACGYSRSQTRSRCRNATFLYDSFRKRFFCSKTGTFSSRMWPAGRERLAEGKVSDRVCSPRMFLNIGTGELFVVFVVAFVLFGPDGVLEVAKTLGKAFRTFQRVSNNARSTFDKLLELDDDDEERLRAQRRRKYQKAKAARASSPVEEPSVEETPLATPPAAKDLSSDSTEATSNASADKAESADEEGTDLHPEELLCRKRVVLLGPPASGKGTQSQKIADRYNLVHICAGDLLREAANQETDAGLRIKSFLDAGFLVPDEDIAPVICDRLLDDDCDDRGWLLDGYPRSVNQAKALKAAGHLPDAIIVLDVDKESLIRRVTGRRLDPVTGSIYHLDYNRPPDDEEIQARLIHRSDDTEETVQTRLNVFEEQVADILDMYSDRDIVHYIEGDNPVDEVFESICQVLETLPKIPGELTGNLQSVDITSKSQLQEENESSAIRDSISAGV